MRERGKERGIGICFFIRFKGTEERDGNREVLYCYFYVLLKIINLVGFWSINMLLL